MKIEIELDDHVVEVLKEAVATRRIPELQVGPLIFLKIIGLRWLLTTRTNGP